MPPKVAFLGPLGTYTHQAVTQQFGKDNVDILPQESIGACFEQLNSRKVDYAVVPFENSTNGQVVFTYDLLRDWLMPKDGNPGKFQVVAEQFVPIHHYLLSKASDLSKVEKLYSHPQVWGQVTKFLKNINLPTHCTHVDVSSTAKAAEIVKNDITNTSACISSYMSSVLYDLPVVVPDIEDVAGNTTRFLVLGYEPIKQVSNGSKITLIMFVLDHDDPGALCLALAAFQTHHVNLTLISSRPSGRTKWQYIFYVEALGDDDHAILASISALQAHCTGLAVVGSFERSR